jgi:hypothetical protein
MMMLNGRGLQLGDLGLGFVHHVAKGYVGSKMSYYFHRMSKESVVGED